MAVIFEAIDEALGRTVAITPEAASGE